MWKWRYSSTILDLRHWMEVSDQIYALVALPPREEPLVPIG
jgi:hypothetical protein